MLKTIMNIFLFIIPNLNEIKILRLIWFKIIGECKFLIENGNNDVKEAIPELIWNALRIMKADGVFNNPKNEGMLELTQKEIDSIFPNFLDKFFNEL